MKPTNKVIEELKVELADLETKEKKLYKVLKHERLGTNQTQIVLLQIQMNAQLTYIEALRERIRNLEAE